VAPRPAARARARPRWLLPALAGLAGTGLLAVAAFLTWQALRGRQPPSVAPAVPRPTLAAPVVPGVARVTVLGAPWGEVSEIRDAEGVSVDLPVQRETPLLLELPAGRYTVTLTHPDAPQPVTCEVEATLGETVECRAELLPLAPLDYFREAGWWQ
jgi:hypothetical protein